MKHKNASHIPPRFLSLIPHSAKPILDPLSWRITLRHFDLSTIGIKLGTKFDSFQVILKKEKVIVLSAKGLTVKLHKGRVAQERILANFVCMSNKSVTK